VIKNTQKQNNIESANIGRVKIVDIYGSILNAGAKPRAHLAELRIVPAVYCEHFRSAALHLEAEPPVPGAYVQNTLASQVLRDRKLSETFFQIRKRRNALNDAAIRQFKAVPPAFVFELPVPDVYVLERIGLNQGSIITLGLIVTVFAALLLLDFRADLATGTGTVELPAGETRLDRPLVIPKGSRHLTLRGNPAGSTLVLAAGFKGSAAIVVDSAADVTFANFAVQGNRTEFKSDWYLPLKEAAFADFYTDNGIVVRKSIGVTVRDVRFTRIRAFPLIVNASSNVLVDSVTIEDSGTLNQSGRNNTTGGILLEEGTDHFVVRGCAIARATGNAIWTHSYARSPRNSDGLVTGNTITTVGRDAVQIGHATRVTVENNRGAELGFPAEYVDVEHHGVAVALDTAGNVDHTNYTRNQFTDVNGQCVDLDGFHDGEVTRNSCINKKPLEAYPALHFGIVFGNNDPGMDSTGIVIRDNTLQGFAYGAAFVIGSHNRIENNHFQDMNLAHCGASPVTARCNYNPELLGTGIYLSGNGGRPTTTRDNVIRSNTIQGFGMKQHCVAGVDLANNTILDNTCSE
jgi:hypothetical protein